ncbi:MULTISPECIES: dihydroxyacetone kinase subunit DhaL [Sorangium]|uniref:Dihydroxyacetone kinase n=1 Tax=Sorangium cellulosum TaxID=56 RepID=A0A4P2QMD4_SORCE|nr:MULTISPECIES: dihydroxyacetone kinase subunit DhaL [Sorangium]AUX31026.1 dihydroxyacetone kinase [Sorangium cellulosum]WCQ90407.1 PEP-dependent dihydroxyacetone kinase, ADP-binding subunit DhaL [Sorangium sp. Soce836]
MQTLSGEHIAAWLERAAEVLEREKAFLTELDAPIGDSDHGVNMARGFAAVRDRLGRLDRGDIGALLKDVGMTLLSTVGGASGPLYGTLFRDAGQRAAGAAALDLAALAGCLEAGLEGVRRRGKASPGDKTMVDALVPAVDALKAALSAPQAADGAALRDALGRAADAARAGVEATVPLVARKGRASYLGERSAGHQDPGATSCWLLLRSLAATAGA